MSGTPNLTLLSLNSNERLCSNKAVKQSPSFADSPFIYPVLVLLKKTFYDYLDEEVKLYIDNTFNGSLNSYFLGLPRSVSTKLNGMLRRNALRNQPYSDVILCAFLEAGENSQERLKYKYSPLPIAGDGGADVLQSVALLTTGDEFMLHSIDLSTHSVNVIVLTKYIETSWVQNNGIPIVCGLVHLLKQDEKYVASFTVCDRKCIFCTSVTGSCFTPSDEGWRNDQHISQDDKVGSVLLALAPHSLEPSGRQSYGRGDEGRDGVQEEESPPSRKAKQARVEQDDAVKEQFPALSAVVDKMEGYDYGCVELLKQFEEEGSDAKDSGYYRVARAIAERLGLEKLWLLWNETRDPETKYEELQTWDTWYWHSPTRSVFELGEDELVIWWCYFMRKVRHILSNVEVNVNKSSDLHDAVMDLPVSFRTHYETMAYLVKQNGMLIDTCEGTLKADIELAKAAVAENPRSIMRVSDALRRDHGKDLVMIAISTIRAVSQPSIDDEWFAELLGVILGAVEGSNADVNVVRAVLEMSTMATVTKLLDPEALKYVNDLDDVFVKEFLS